MEYEASEYRHVHTSKNLHIIQFDHPGHNAHYRRVEVTVTIARCDCAPSGKLAMVTWSEDGGRVVHSYTWQEWREFERKTVPEMAPVVQSVFYSIIRYVECAYDICCRIGRRD